FGAKSLPQRMQRSAGGNLSDSRLTLWFLESLWCGCVESLYPISGVRTHMNSDLRRSAGVLVSVMVCLCSLAAGAVSAMEDPGESSASKTQVAGSAADIQLSGVDSIIRQSIEDGNIPGAVLVVGHDGKVIYRKAYGERALDPRREPMTLDTIFDLASLTKVIATTTAVMQLMEQGKVRM